MRETVIGILGGMGPAATAKFYSDLVAQTPAQCDADHYHVIVDSNVKIPDRTGFIVGKNESPVAKLVESAKRLAIAGVDVACMPCMTAHYYYKDIAAAVDYPILHAMLETDHYIKAHYGGVKKIGILCTSGTKAMQLFDAHLTSVEIFYPSDEDQQRVMQAIYGDDGIKAGNVSGKPVALLSAVAQHLVERGAELIIAGCTEVPLALRQEHVSVPLLNPLHIVIEKLLTYK
ncbi:MAG: aspartate racemase [Clostridiales bacterium]|nr:MAG: aspartate racemase [Clostridiales bacterium]